MKFCKDCQTDKPECDFYKNSHNADGLMTYCKPCHTKRTGDRKRVRAGLPMERTMVKINTKLKMADDGTRTCTECRKPKPQDEFATNGFAESGKQLYRGYCKECSNGLLADARQDDQRRFKSYRLKSTYKITLEEVEAKVNEQGGCAICHTPEPTGHGWTVDHDHACCPGEKSCGECVRAILCMNCNNMLGCARDNAEVLKAGIKYLESFRVSYPEDDRTCPGVCGGPFACNCGALALSN